MAWQQHRSRRWGPVPWHRLPFEPASGPPPRHPDVAIVGGGLTGVSAAYYLARRGVRAVLFEADAIGSGASGRTGGLALEGLTHGARDGARDCLAGLAKLVDDLRIDCGLALPGCWEIEHRVRSGGESLPWIDGGAPIRIARIVPGGVVEPALLVTGIARAAIDAGAVVYEGRPVERMRFAPALELEVSLEKIKPGAVVVGLNAWTASLIPEARSVHSALTYACVTEPLSEQALKAIGLEQRIPFYTMDTPYLWGRVCDDRSVVFGAGLTYGDPMGLETVAVDDHEPLAILDRLVQRIRSLNPILAHIPIRSRWAGPVAFREGAVPILTRHPANENALIAGAYAGHGVAFSVHAGRLMAEAIVDGTPLPAWGAIE